MSSASTSTPERFPALPMSLPYFLGCPSWNEPAWRGTFYPRRPASRRLPWATTAASSTPSRAIPLSTPAPTPKPCARWAQTMPAGFRFCAKFPRDISHEGDLRGRLEAAGDFLELLAPLGVSVSPLWLQLSAGFGPERLGELAAWLDAFAERRLAVEVRHPAFFAKGEEERPLNRLLRERGVERICLDSRALFGCRSDDPAVLHAQSKKPRVPIRPAAFSDTPQVRFIGGPDLPANRGRSPCALGRQGGRLDRAGPDALRIPPYPGQPPCRPAGPALPCPAAPAPAGFAGAVRADPGPGSGATGPALSTAPNCAWRRAGEGANLLLPVRPRSPPP